MQFTETQTIQTRSEERKPSLFSEAGLTAADIRYFQERKKPAADVHQELRSLSSTPREISVSDAATLGNGYLFNLTPADVTRALEVFEQAITSRPLRYVIPTAGAASRQFQLLRIITHHPALCEQTSIDGVLKEARAIEARSGGKVISSEEKAEIKMMREVLGNLERFWYEGVRSGRYAFLDELRACMADKGHDFDQAVACGDIQVVARHIIESAGLNYGALPKALMRFHTYTDAEGRRTHRLALEEHLRMAVALLRGAPSVDIHFIISEEHERPFALALHQVRTSPALRAHLSANGFRDRDLHVSWDFQAPETDSVALLRRDHRLARDGSGRPLLRKAGHGALLPNFSNLECDGMWTQNVDNALYDNAPIQGLALTYKRIMAGLAIDAETRVHGYVRRLFELEAHHASDARLNGEVVDFCRRQLLTEIPPEVLAGRTPAQVGDTLLRILQRPIVAAGYVPLEPGQAGGGPFVLDTEIAPGLVVRKVNTVEGAEFSGGQANPIFKQGEFFNPVNLFISRRKFDGSRFELGECVDTNRCFIAEKTDAQGNPLLTYERPGLWNGSLARALQISIPMPSNTFSAVKDCAGKESFLAPLHHPYAGPDFTDLDDRRGVANQELKSLLREHAGRFSPSHAS